MDQKTRFSEEIDPNKAKNRNPSAATAPEESTQTLGSAASRPPRPKRKTYLIIGAIVGVLVIAGGGFLAVMQMQAAQVNKALALGESYLEEGKYEEAIDILEKQITLTEDRDALKKLYDQLIPAYPKAGKTEAEILALLERAAKATGEETYLAKKDTYLVKKPSFSLAPGEYAGAQNLDLVKGNSGDKLFYTIDGTTPTMASREYTSPIPLADGEVTVKIIEVNAAGIASLPVEGKFIVKKAALSKSKSVETVKGAWYTNGFYKRQIVISDQHCYIGYPAADADLFRSYAIFGTYNPTDSTTGNGTSIVMDPDPEAYTLGLSSLIVVDFDFATPNDGKALIRIDGGDWAEYTAGEPIGNGQYRLPGMGPDNSDYITTVYSNEL